MHDVSVVLNRMYTDNSANPYLSACLLWVVCASLLPSGLWDGRDSLYQVWTVLMLLVSFFPQGPSALPFLRLLLDIFIATLTPCCFPSPIFLQSPVFGLVFIDSYAEFCFSLTDEHILYVLFTELHSWSLLHVRCVCLEKPPWEIQGFNCSTIPVWKYSNLSF